MNKYESIFIVNPNVEEEGLKALEEKFTTLINSDGKVESVEELYLPIRDYSRPIYSRRERLHFKDEADKKLFLMRSLMEYKANQKKDERI